MIDALRGIVFICCVLVAFALLVPEEMYESARAAMIIKDTAEVIGIFGWMFIAYGLKTMITRTDVKRRRKLLSSKLAESGFCCKGYKGEHNINDIRSKCSDASLETCKQCILRYIEGDES